MSQNYEDFAGETFQFTGPAEYTYKEVAEYVQDVTFLRKNLVDVPVPVASAAGAVLEHAITPFWTQDMCAQLLEDVVKKNDSSLKTLQDLNIEPVHMDQMAFDYLHRFRKGGHFTLVKGYH